MEKWLKKRAALYLLIKIVDENNGRIDINTNGIRRVFNDVDDIVKIEYENGNVRLLADISFETMNNIILEWKANQN